MRPRIRAHKARTSLWPWLWIAMCLLPRALAAQKVAEPDTESWSEIDLSGPVSHRLTLTIPIVVRNSFSLSDPQLMGVGPLFDFVAWPHLTLTGGYLFVALPNTGHAYNVNVPLAAVTFRTRVDRLRLSDRNRAEGLVGLPRNPIRFRNKFILDLPLREERWQPFLSDEVFYDFSQSAWTQNRFQAGVGHEVGRRVRLDVFYMERNARHGHPAASHILGSTLQFKFTRETKRESVSHEEN